MLVGSAQVGGSAGSYPLGLLWDHFGGPLTPLGTILDDFGIILGPSDYRKGPQGDEERLWDDLLLFFEDIQ